MKYQKLAALLFISLSLYQQALSQQKTLDSQTKSAVIDSVCRALIRNYIFRDTASEMVAYINKRQREKAYDTITNPSHFAALIAHDVRQVLNDRHINFIYNPFLEKRILEPAKASPAKGQFVQKDAKENFAFKKLEILPGNIGYMEFTSFSDTSDLARKTVRAAMQFLSNTDVLIIDLRSNYGGSGPMVAEMTTYFFNGKTHSGRTFNGINKTWQESYIEPDPSVTQGLYMGMPVYLLVSNKTISGGEAFAYTLQTLRKAIVFGEQTVGSVHLSRTFALGNGFIGFIPISRSENLVTKTDPEGKGIVPDIPGEQDSALWKAEEFILTRKLDTTQDKTEQSKITWELNALRGRHEMIIVPKEKMEQYTGDFDGILFSVENDKLVFTNTHSNNRTDFLTPISGSLFQIDFQSQVEFVKDGTGKVSSIRLYWNDGWIDTFQKSAK
jgi:hypothetical protein